MFESIDFSPGKITYNATNDVHYLKEEDLFQVSYSDSKYIIDLGWYRIRYAIKVIKNMDWANPLQEKECKEVHDLEGLMKECVDYVHECIKSQPNFTDITDC